MGSLVCDLGYEMKLGLVIDAKEPLETLSTDKEWVA